MIKEVTVFTSGDSSEIKTWSNVPYLFTEALKSKGVRINRVDISPSPTAEKIFNLLFLRVLRRLRPGSSYCYFRSPIHFLDVRRRVRRALSRYGQADANVFLTFSFSSVGLTKKPTILFGDWTYDHYFKYFLGRQPDCLERASVQREDRQIEGADLVVSLFPGVATYMQERYANQNIHYLGNVINAVEVPRESDLQLKTASQNLLFIGKKKYLEGARTLINAYVELKKQYPRLSVHIVGMASDAFESLPAGVSCYGYLDKANQEERNKYYELLRTAKVFINTTALWGAFSAMMEAMYFYVPVITTCYSECARTFGQKIDFGYYAENGSVEALCCRIREVLEHPAYTSLCVKAHEAVQGYTWSAFADQMLQKMDRLTSPKRVWTLAATKYEASSINPGSTEVAGLGHPLKSAWATTNQ